MPVCKERDKKSPDYCRDYRECNGKEWFDWQDLRWCPHQVWWILENEELLSEGIWPEPPDYIDKGSIQRALMSSAYYIKAIYTLAVVRMRLKRVHRKDIITMWEDVRAGVEFYEILNREVWDQTQNAVLYISGWYSKRTNYRLYKAKRIYRAKNRRATINIQAIKSGG